MADGDSYAAFHGRKVIPGVFANISPLKNLDVQSPQVVDDWKLWRQLFENYLISCMDQTSEKFKVVPV